MNITISKCITPTQGIADAFTKWENDPALIPFMRPNPNEEALHRQEIITLDDLTQRLAHSHIYLIYLEGQLIGELSYQVDPLHLYKKEPNTAWIGITLGEAHARGKGIGFHAMQYLEHEIKQAGCPRIELGVFEFNTNAIKLYLKLGYTEIARIDNFTYWQGKLWTDIRLEKYI
jgi:RimJ/RimL family protein N-acetyltransferase